ncbi:MAG TPA: tetratricopeptide repeat protein [Bacteroidetes bacterium]|nr:tetratricopeptide repeat protein [Bacteroidota bacterium]
MGFFKYIILFLLIVFGTVSLNAQSYLPKNKKAKKYYKQGRKKFEAGDFDKAIKYFEKTLNKEPDFIPVYYQLASIFYKRKEFQKSEDYYKKSIKIDSSFNVQVYYSLAIVLEKQGKLQEALKYYKRFLTKSNINGDLEKKALKKIKNIPFRIFALSHPVSFEPKSIGNNINTINNEYLPVLTGDNSKLIFTRRINSQEDFYMSIKKDGKWQKAIPVKELNTPANEGAHTLTPDGKTIYFTVCDRSRSYGSCDLFMSNKENGKWTEPVNLGEIINSPFWESQPSISVDRKTLYFASNRPGGIGGKDIWVSTKDKAGRWTKPVCLDTTVNTIADEKAPYIHPDNKTLYFTSSGHTGMGGLDLFLSKKVKGKWTDAKNLGYPVNTKNDEGALFVSLDGKTAYFSTDRAESKRKNLDIYYFDLDTVLQPEKVTYVKGIVFDKKSLVKLSAKLELYDNSTGEKILDKRTDKDTFLLPLKIGIDYNFSVSKKGYLFYSGRFNLNRKNTIIEPYELKISLTKIDDMVKHGSQPVVLPNIFFEYKSAVLDTIGSGAELNKLIKLLKNNPETSIRIIGHTDNVGSESYNLQLSQKRAKAVYDYLISKNIAENRMEYIGYGETKPISSNDTEKGRSKNRRIEFEILNK